MDSERSIQWAWAVDALSPPFHRAWVSQQVFLGVFFFTGIIIPFEGGQLILFLTFDFNFSATYFIAIAKFPVGKCYTLVWVSIWEVSVEWNEWGESPVASGKGCVSWQPAGAGSLGYSSRPHEGSDASCVMALLPRVTDWTISHFSHMH